MKNINAITTAVFLNNSKTAMAATVWQYDYGMKLRLQGLQLPAAVEIHFSVQETRGEAITRVGTTQDGVTDVTIPDSLLENDDATRNYLVYAFVYLTDETSGQTEYKVTIPVNSRPRPNGRNKPEETELFRQAIDAVNTAADRAEAAGTTAQSWATGGTDTRDGEDTDNAKYYAQQAKKAVDDAAEAFKGSTEQIETNKTDITALKEDIDNVNDAIFVKNENKKIEWIPNLIANAEVLQKYTNNQTSKPFLLKAGETVKVKTKGNGEYWFNAISRVPSIDSKIEEHSVPLENLVPIDSNQLKEYTYTANETIPLIACTMMDETSSITFSNLKKDSKIEELSTAVTLINDNIDNINDLIIIENKKNIEFVEGFTITDRIIPSNKDKVTKPITLYSGETIKVKTKGDAEYMFVPIASVDNADVIIANQVKTESLAGNITSNSLTEYTYTASSTIVVVACVLNDETSSITFSNLKKDSKMEIIEEKLDEVGNRINGILQQKNVMFFGDSLFSASNQSVIGFAEIIASNYDMPYISFLYDNDDGNNQDVTVSYKRFVNYAKDGTTNHTIQSRKDSVIDRVKRHVTDDTDVDYILIQCCVNDAAPIHRNKGNMESGYDSEFDTASSLGAIEEIIKYITMLGKPIHLGFVIPWTISWVDDDWFDEYIPIFKKWGIPYLDMRKIAGFDMKHCTAHRLLYSLSADDYDLYDPAKIYNLDDKVKYQGILYKCLTNDVVGILPTNAEKWMAVSSESSDGTHLNSLGHKIVVGKIMSFLESL